MPCVILLLITYRRKALVGSYNCISLLVENTKNERSMSEVKQHGIDIELDAEVAQGHYSNLAIISHSPTEFVVDFAAILPGMPKAKVVSRIILTPEHAKRVLMSLQENVARYETNVGRIELQQPQNHISFKNHGEA